MEVDWALRDLLFVLRALMMAAKSGVTDQHSWISSWKCRDYGELPLQNEIMENCPCEISDFRLEKCWINQERRAASSCCSMLGLRSTRKRARRCTVWARYTWPARKTESTSAFNGRMLISRWRMLISPWMLIYFENQTGCEGASQGRREGLPAAR